MYSYIIYRGNKNYIQSNSFPFKQGRPHYLHTVLTKEHFSRSWERDRCRVWDIYLVKAVTEAEQEVSPWFSRFCPLKSDDSPHIFQYGPTSVLDQPGSSPDDIW